jgi:hypothetical protein
MYNVTAFEKRNRMSNSSVSLAVPPPLVASEGIFYFHKSKYTDFFIISRDNSTKIFKVLYYFIC